MSRSYRKPIITDGYGTKRRREAKKAANRCIRRAPSIPNGMAYRKFFDPWDICDFRFSQWAPPTEDRITHGFGWIYIEPLEEQIKSYRKGMRK